LYKVRAGRDLLEEELALDCHMFCNEKGSGKKGRHYSITS
jgi:hypothetical protein